MENASKALFIAGAILLAILIIGLAVFIFNQAANTVGDTGMDQVAVRQFNGQFEPYLNRELGTSGVKALIDTVDTNNRISSNGIRLDGISRKSELQFGHRYSTEPVYTDDGVISRIIISDTNGSTGTGGNGGTSFPSGLLDDPDSFNALFTPYLQRELSEKDFDKLQDLVDSVNSQFGSNTVYFHEGTGGKWTCYDGNGWVARSVGKWIRIQEIEYARSSVCSY